MSIKATIIGAAAPETGSKLAPTRLGSQGSGGANPTQPAPPAQPAMRPTAFKPTSTPGEPAREQAPAAQPTALAKPTAMPFRAPEPIPAPAEPVRASALPGTQRRPLAVTYDQLVLRFPGTDAAVLERTRAILAGVSPNSMSASSWLSFGEPAQRALSDLVKERMVLMEGVQTHSVSQHLARLTTLLREVLDAMDGGFFKKPATTVWAANVGEVRQLESLLSSVGPALATLLGDMTTVTSKNQEAGAALQAYSLAAEYLVDIVGADVGHLLVSRATSLTSSMALVLEQIQLLTLDITNVQELMTLVQNGVLLQLPAVYSQLAGLSTKPSDTQRYLATEKLNEIVNFMQRKL
jgi:hypothetical protein